MYCNRCKKQIRDDSIFCDYCGAKIRSNIQNNVQNTNPAFTEQPQIRPVQPIQNQQVPNISKTSMAKAWFDYIKKSCFQVGNVKIPYIVIVLVAILLLGGGIWAFSSSGPKSVAEKWIEAVNHKDTKTIYQLMPPNSRKHMKSDEVSFTYSFISNVEIVGEADGDEEDIEEMDADGKVTVYKIKGDFPLGESNQKLYVFKLDGEWYAECDFK